MEKEIDLEAGVILSEGLRGTDTISGATLARTFLFCKGFDNAERTIKVEVGLCLSDTNAASAEKVKSPLDVKTEGEEAANVAESQVGKEKRKVSSAKKSSKPPRPPQGLILYASDHKLVKEIAELAILKKARKERKSSVGQMLSLEFLYSFPVMSLEALAMAGADCRNFTINLEEYEKHPPPYLLTRSKKRKYHTRSFHTLSNVDDERAKSRKRFVGFSSFAKFVKKIVGRISRFFSKNGSSTRVLPM
ncbi:hypothetical protein DCAR_0935381 [Daucus carota subsp. sativus]|uniref:Uncharacterized protein n=1 Tax=Daucus carota subsp. sativus TaxID=79200 RepID=A0A175YGT1_DAUCS|nr:hypothetical protein DCAR_0935381 [Daucus carota subsp. sativus]